MEITVISSEKDSMELELEGVSNTTIYAIVDRLSKDPKVYLARYASEHPDLDRPRISLKVNDGKPETAFKRAAKGILTDLTDLKKVIEKAK